uniref:Uncharacterized protein n=1 Tax=Globodera rostochiensis TaxID=31243 RepID=A0A914GQ73_GLORO
MYYKSHRIGSKTFLLLLALITFNAILVIKAQDESDEGGGESAGGDASPEAGGDTDGEGSADNAEEHNNNNESAGEGESGQNEEHQQEGSEEEPDQQQHSDDEESAEEGGGKGGAGGGKGGDGGGKGGAGAGKGGAGGGKGGGKGGAGGGKGGAGGGKGGVPGAGTGTAGQPNTAGQPGQLPGGQPANPIPPGGIQPQTGGIQPAQLPGGGQQLPSPYPSPYPASNAGQYPSYPVGGQGQQPSPSSFYPNPAYPSSSSDTYYPPNPSPYYPDTRQPYEPYQPTYESGGDGFRQNRPLDDRDFFDDNFGFGSASGLDRSLPSVINGDNFDPGHPQGRLMAGATFVAPEEQSHLPPVLYGARFRRFAAGGEMPTNPRNGGRRTKRRTMLCFVPSPGTRQNGNMDFWRYNLLKYSPNQFQRHFPYRTNGEIHGQEGAWGRRKRRQMDFPEGSGSFPEYRRHSNYGGFDNGGHGGGGNNPSLICQPIDDNGYGGGGERGAPISEPIGRGGHLPRRDDHY